MFFNSITGAHLTFPDLNLPSSFPHALLCWGGAIIFYFESLLASKCNNLPLFPSLILSICCFFCAKCFSHVCQGFVLFWDFPLFILRLLFGARERYNLKSFSRKEARNAEELLPSSCLDENKNNPLPSQPPSHALSI